MKQISEIVIPEALQYTQEHVWAKRQDAELLVGITDFAQDQLGEVSYVELPEVGSHVEAGAGFGTVESIKSVNTLCMPVSGTITAVNDVLDATPSLVNVGCYEQGWMIRLLPGRADDLGTMLSAEAYRSFLKK